MDVLRIEHVLGPRVSLFDLRLSEGELMVYEGCIEYVLNNCDQATIQRVTGCDTHEELSSFWAALRELIKNHVLPDYQLERFKD